MYARIPIERIPMKIKRVTTNERIEDNKIDAEMVCNWEGHDVKLVMTATPILAGRRLLSDFKVGDDIQIKGELLITERHKREGANELPRLMLREPQIIYGRLKDKEFQADPAVKLIMNPVFLLEDPTKSLCAFPLFPPEPSRTPRIQDPPRNSSTGFTPFFLNTGAEPLTPATPHSSPTLSFPHMKGYVQQLSQASTLVQGAIPKAQLQGHQGNKHRRDVNYKVGDRVFLDLASIPLAHQTGRASGEPQPQFAGPFTITEKVTSAMFRLELPATMHLFPILHASVLKPEHESPHESKERDPSQPPLVTMNREEHELEYILGYKESRGQKYHHVKWGSYGNESNGWLQEEDYANSPDPIDEFWNVWCREGDYS